MQHTYIHTSSIYPSIHTSIHPSIHIYYRCIYIYTCEDLKNAAYTCANAQSLHILRKIMHVCLLLSGLLAACLLSLFPHRFGGANTDPAALRSTGGAGVMGWWGKRNKSKTCRGSSSKNWNHYVGLSYWCWTLREGYGQRERERKKY